jgi:CRISPR-associated protein, Cas8b/Csh1 subtype I-B
MICNKPASADEHKQPLPFFTINKPNFIPDGLNKNSAKVLSLCTSCYNDLQTGFKYIQNNDSLNHNIPKSYGRSRLWLWIIPQLNDPILVQRFLTNIESEKGLASFKEMLNLSKRMETVRDFDLHSYATENTDKFLTYIALFYCYDERGHMSSSYDQCWYGYFCKLIANAIPVGCHPVLRDVILLLYSIRRNTREQIFSFWNGFKKIRMQFHPC